MVENLFVDWIPMYQQRCRPRKNSLYANYKLMQQSPFLGIYNLKETIMDAVSLVLDYDLGDEVQLLLMFVSLMKKWWR